VAKTTMVIRYDSSVTAQKYNSSQEQVIHATEIVKVLSPFLTHIVVNGLNFVVEIVKV
jgi:hypothetical protein